jgi:hypothetical protein
MRTRDRTNFDVGGSWAVFPGRNLPRETDRMSRFASGYVSTEVGIVLHFKPGI